MYKKPFAIILFVWILLIAIFHNIAMAYYIYWRFLWTDLVVHFLSGFWVALVGFWVFRFWIKKTDIKPRTVLLVTLGFALLVGGLWEVFEYGVGIVEYSSRYTTDTILDIVMDVFGGAAGFAVALWYEKKLDNKNNHEG